MEKIIPISFIVILLLHGFIHLIGFIAYWPLGKISELPYKTTVLGGRWDIGSVGTRYLSMLWLLAGLGIIVAALGMISGRPWWATVLAVAVLFSLILCILNCKAAFLGAWIDIGILFTIFVVFGLRVKPVPFPEFVSANANIDTIVLPDGLPKPVERFFRQTYGDKIPVYQSAVMSGHGPLRLMAITFPARMRFSHISGESYHHYIEATFYGFPILKVNEWFVDGHSRLELPFKVVENDECTDSAANQGLWAESLLYPSVLLSDARVHWEALDPNHARLYVPFGDSEQVFTIRFDQQSGRMVHYETMRCHDNKTGLMRWWGDIRYKDGQNGKPLGISATWEDEGTPWLNFELEETAFNSDLRDHMRQRGP